MEVTENTYPVYPNCPHAEPGDQVYWVMGRGALHLARKVDHKYLFSTAPVDRDGRLRSNGKLPTICGTIAQVKNKGWRLVIKESPQEQ